MSSERPLRVCHLAYTFYDHDNRVIRYAEVLRDRGDRVDVISLRRPGQARRVDANGVRVYQIQRRAVTEKRAWAYLLKIAWFFIKSMLFLSWLQLRRRYDVVHVHNVPDFLVFSAVVPKLMGAGIILDIHDILPELYAGKFGSEAESAMFRALLMIERLSCRFADQVLVANHLWHEKLITRSVPIRKCMPIINHPDLQLFSPLPHNERIKRGRFLVLYPGTLNHHQGVDIAIRAFARLTSEMPDAEFHIYGEGPARPALARLMREVGLIGRVKIMDRVPLRDVARIMAGADVGVVPKRADGFGNEAFSTKILEFMACGVPVIVSRTEVDDRYFNDSLVRFFVPGDEDDLSRAILWVYQHRGEHTAWIRAARDFAVRNSWQECASSYLGVIEALTAKRSRLPGSLD